MKKTILFIFLLALLTIFSFFYVSKSKPAAKPDLLVTIAPYKYFIERLTDHSLNVKNLVPSEADPHGFEPSAKELATLFSAKAWFLIGEPFEDHFLPILKRNNPDLKAISLHEDIQSTLALKCCHHSHSHVEDLHFWMSPKITQAQVKKIAEELIVLYPEKTALITTQLATLNQEFEDLNHYFEEKLSHTSTPFLLVSHPAFGYFCKDYHLVQLALEDETQDTSPKAIAELFSTIKENKIKRIYVQKQHNYKMAKLTANSLNLEMVEVNPYSENYFENMKLFADHLGN